MKCTVAGDDQKRLMLDILKRAYQGSDSDGSDSNAGDSDDGGGEPHDDGLQGVLSKETMQKLMLKVESGKEVDLEDLENEEMEGFIRAADQGRLNHLVQAWEPWWQLPEVATLHLSASGEAVVVELPGPTASPPPHLGAAGRAATHIPPPVGAALPPLSALTKAQPSPTLQYSVLEALFTYCHLMRTFNGEPASDMLHAVSIASHLSPSLLPLQPSATAHSPGSASEALLTTTSAACSPPLGSAQDRPLAAQLWADVLRMLHSGRPCIITALADLQRLLEAALSHLRQLAAPTSRPCGRSKPHRAVGPHGDARACGSSIGGGADVRGAVAQERRRHRAALKAAALKVRFFLSWANEQPAALTAKLACLLAAELDLLQQQLPTSLPPAATSTAGMLAAATGRPARRPLACQQAALVQDITARALHEELDRSSSYEALDAGKAALLRPSPLPSSAASSPPLDASGDEGEAGRVPILPEQEACCESGAQRRDEGSAAGSAVAAGCNCGLALELCKCRGRCIGGDTKVGSSGQERMTHGAETEVPTPAEWPAAAGSATADKCWLEGAAWQGTALQGQGGQLNMLD